MREDVISYQTQVNGFPVTAVYSRQTVEEVLVPLLQKFTALWEERGRRIVIFLAAPPAAGKSTLALFLQHLSEMLPGVRPLQAVGLDGFHYPNAWLDTHETVRSGVRIPLRKIKGGPETYDTIGFLKSQSHMEPYTVRIIKFTIAGKFAASFFFCPILAF